jgi:hypothetical protein
MKRLYLHQFLLLLLLFCATIICNINVGYCDEVDDQVDKMIKKHKFPDDVLTDDFQNFLKRALLAKKRLQKEGIDYLFKEKIFETKDDHKSDSSTYQRIINMQFDTIDLNNSKQKNKNVIKSFRFNNSIGQSTCISTCDITSNFFTNGDIENYSESKGNIPNYSYAIVFYKDIQSVHRIFVDYKKANYTRAITWDINGKLISDEKNYYIGTPEWNQEQLEFQKKLEERIKQEEEN